MQIFTNKPKQIKTLFPVQANLYFLTQTFQGNDINLTSSGCDRTECLAKYWTFFNKSN